MALVCADCGGPDHGIWDCPMKLNDGELLAVINRRWHTIHVLEDIWPSNDLILAKRQKLLKELEPYGVELQRRGL